MKLSHCLLNPHLRLQPQGFLMRHCLSLTFMMNYVLLGFGSVPFNILIKYFFTINNLLRRPGSNWRPKAYEASELPLLYRAMFKKGYNN